MTIRIIAVCVLTIAGALAGNQCARAKRLYATQLQSLIEATQRLGTEMLTNLRPLTEALEHARHPLFSRAAQLLRMGGAGSARFREARALEMARSGSLCAIETEDVRILDNWFSELGLSGLERQKIALDACLEALAIRLHAARLRADEQAKLYQTLGVLLGLALSICLL